MKVFLCLPDTPGTGFDRLEKKVGNTVPKNTLQVFRSTDNLAWMLRRPGSRCDIAVLVAASGRALDRFVTLQPLLKDVGVLLLLPDREPATALKGHKLYPRFISYLDSDPGTILAVMQKMMRHVESRSRFQTSDTIPAQVSL